MSDPLITCSKASRRLQLLFRHGIRQGSAPGSSLQAPSASAITLTAKILKHPVSVDWLNAAAAEAAWLGARDPQLEVAVGTATLKSLLVPAGCFVKVSNPSSGDGRPRLARLLLLESAAPTDAHLSPSLAFNLGLSLHLTPLLQGVATERSSCEERVLLSPVHQQGQPAQHYAAAVVGNQTIPRPVAHILQPSSEPLEVPVAASVRFAVVRTPASALLAQAVPKDSEQAQENQEPLKSDTRIASPAGSSEERKGEEVVQALQEFLLSGTRMVSPGDIMVVPRQQPRFASKLLGNLSPDLNWNRSQTLAHPARVGQQAGGVDGGQLHAGHARPEPTPLPVSVEVLHFKVLDAVPAVEGPLAVDACCTEVRLEGSCSSGLPPSLSTYLAPSSQDPTGEIDHEQLETDCLPRSHNHQGCWQQLGGLLASALHPAGSQLPLRVGILVHGPPGSGKQTAVRAAAQAVGYHVVQLSCYDIKPMGVAEQKALEAIKAAFEAAGDYRPVVLLLEHFDALAKEVGGGANNEAFAARAGTVLNECMRNPFRLAISSNHGHALNLEQRVCDGLKSDGMEHRNNLSSPPTGLVVVACTTSLDAVPPPLRRCFTHEIALEAPDQQGRYVALCQTLCKAGKAHINEEMYKELARHTAGLLPRELRALAADAVSLAVSDVLPTLTCPQVVEDANEAHADRQALLNQAHLSAALEAVRSRTTTELGAPKIPNVKWEDVGGLEDVKRAILDTVELPLKYPELFAGGLRRRSGVLLYGPPGTGKTLLAKAVATECGINFLSVKGPELINMYVGESERQIREVFTRARRARPCVVFFDELDSLAPARGKGSDSGGVMDRVVAQLLAEIDGVQGGSGSDDLFIIGATNRPDLLDSALMRPGRLDRLLFVGIAEDVTSRVRILEALTRNFDLHDDVDLQSLAIACPPRFTGADLYAICSDAWMHALRRKMSGVLDDCANESTSQEIKKSSKSVDASSVLVTHSDFLSAIHTVQPSLSLDEIKKYERIRSMYEHKQNK